MEINGIVGYGSSTTSNVSEISTLAGCDCHFVSQHPSCLTQPTVLSRRQFGFPMKATVTNWTRLLCIAIVGLVYAVLDVVGVVHSACTRVESPDDRRAVALSGLSRRCVWQQFAEIKTPTYTYANVNTLLCILQSVLSGIFSTKLEVFSNILLFLCTTLSFFVNFSYLENSYIWGCVSSVLRDFGAVCKEFAFIYFLPAHKPTT